MTILITGANRGIGLALAHIEHAIPSAHDAHADQCSSYDSGVWVRHGDPLCSHALT